MYQNCRESYTSPRYPVSGHTTAAMQNFSSPILISSAVTKNVSSLSVPGQRGAGEENTHLQWQSTLSAQSASKQGCNQACPALHLTPVARRIKGTRTRAISDLCWTRIHLQNPAYSPVAKCCYIHLTPKETEVKGLIQGHTARKETAATSTFIKWWTDTENVV